MGFNFVNGINCWYQSGRGIILTASTRDGFGMELKRDSELTFENGAGTRGTWNSLIKMEPGIVFSASPGLVSVRD